MATDDEKCKDAQKWRHTGAGTTENLMKEKVGHCTGMYQIQTLEFLTKLEREEKKLHLMYMFRIICGSTQQSSAFLHFAA